VGLLALIIGCVKSGNPEAAGAPTPGDAVWYDVLPGKGVCLSRVPSAGKMSKTDRAGFDAALAAIQKGDLAAADTALEPLSAHPGVEDLRAVVGMLKGDASKGNDLLALADANPSDACLNATAALADTGRGGDGRSYVARARTAAPDDPRIAFLAWYLGVDSDDLVPTLEKGLAADPENPGYALAVGIDRLRKGDKSGLQLVESAVAGGMSDGIGVLLVAYYQEHQMPEYLKLASKVGLLPDDGKVATAEDPVAQFQQELGQVPGVPLVATFETTQGTFECTLLPESAPVSVANFVGLARGTRPWLDPRDGEVKKLPLYDGTTFHRVIPEFMVQGGDPTGTGKGDPGFQFLDEIDPSQRFDHPGVLALANSGPNTNGSQFFVTEVPAPNLDGHHTVIGQCGDAAVQVVKKIARVPRDPEDKPVDPVTLTHLTITPAGAAGTP